MAKTCLNYFIVRSTTYGLDFVWFDNDCDCARSKIAINDATCFESWECAQIDVDRLEKILVPGTALTIVAVTCVEEE